MDCNPLNPNEHGVYSWIKSKFTREPTPVTQIPGQFTPAPPPLSTPVPAPYLGPTRPTTDVPTFRETGVVTPAPPPPLSSIPGVPDLPTEPIPSPTPQESRALHLRREIKEAAIQRGRPFTRTEAVRAMGGGKGVAALRSATRKGFYLKQQQEVAARGTLFPDKPKAEQLMTLAPPLTRAEKVEIEKQKFIEKYPTLGKVAYPGEVFEDVREKFPKTTEFFAPPLEEEGLVSFYNPILAMAVPTKQFVGFPKRRFLATVERKGDISKIRTITTEKRVNLFGEKVVGESPLHSIGEQIVLAKGELAPGVSRGVQFGLKEVPPRARIKPLRVVKEPKKPVDIEPFVGVSVSQRLGKGRLVKDLGIVKVKAPVGEGALVRARTLTKEGIEKETMAFISKRAGLPEERFVEVIGGKPKLRISKKGVEGLVIREPSIGGRVFEVTKKVDEGVRVIRPTGIKKTPFALTFQETRAVGELALARPTPKALIKPTKLRPYGVGVSVGVSARERGRISDSKFARDFIDNFIFGRVEGRAKQIEKGGIIPKAEAKPLTKKERDELKEEERKRYDVFLQKEGFKGRQLGSDFVLGQGVGRMDMKQGVNPVFDTQQNVMEKPLQVPMQQFIQAQPPRVKERFAELDLISPREGVREREKQRLRERLALKQRADLFQIPAIREAVREEERIAQLQAQALRLRERQRVAQAQAFAQPTPSRMFMPGDVIPRKRPKPRYVKAPGYDSYVLIDSTKPGKKRWMRLNEEMLTKESANSMGAEYTDRNINATYMVKPREVVEKKTKDGIIVRFPREHVRVLDSGSKYFQNNKSKFRDFKVARGKKLPMQLTKIEKAKHRLDTAQEKMQIALAPKQLKQRKKVSKPKPRKNNPVRKKRGPFGF